MCNEHKILEVQTLDVLELNPSLKEAISPFKWRIEQKRFLELFIEMNNNVVEGFGISWENPIHPTAKYIHAVSDVNGTELMNKLLANTFHYNKIIFSCWENEQNKIQLIQSFQFELFRKTYIEHFEVDTLLKRLQSIDNSPALFTLHQTLNNKTLEEDLFIRLKQSYEQTHLHNPVRNLSWQSWKEMLLDDDPDLKVSKVWNENDQVHAYIFVHKVNAEHYEIGWIGNCMNVDLKRILKSQLIELKSFGVKTVEFEIDTTDWNAYQFAELLELHNKRSWDSYIFVKI